MLVVTEILHRKGKIKTIKELKPQYQLNIQSEIEERAKRQAKKEEKRQNKLKQVDNNKIEDDLTKSKADKEINDNDVSIEEKVAGKENPEEVVGDKKQENSSKNEDKKDSQ